MKEIIIEFLPTVISLIAICIALYKKDNKANIKYNLKAESEALGPIGGGGSLPIPKK